MKVRAIVVDRRPPFLDPAGSLLLLPVGRGTLLAHVRRLLGDAAREGITVLATFAPDASYPPAIRAACDAADRVVAAEGLAALVETFEPSDALLVVDPATLPAGGLPLGRLLAEAAADPRLARHVVALDGSACGSKDRVHLDGAGRVRRIQRYYDAVTWPFASAVAASLVPASCALLEGKLPLSSPGDLRAALAARGVAARDVPVEGGAFDLCDERGFLALGEREARAAASRGAAIAPDARIEPGARLLGPVIVQGGAVVEAGATVIGPAVLGAGARVGRGATVAQCSVAAGAVVGENRTARHRVIAGAAEGLRVLRRERGPGPEPGGRRRVPPPSRAIEVELGDGARPSLYPKARRAVEAVLAGAALVALSPVLAACAAAVKASSAGPVLYGDEREGLGGKVFRCWKFRTMVANAHALQRALYAQNQVDGPQFKLDDDPRVTRVGRFLRASALDELPQLWNVVRGQMSLVGPRPSPFRENQLCEPWREARLSVRPGVTGLWQVCRHDRSHGDFYQWIHYDVLYIRHRSPWLDLKIVCTTPVALAARVGIPLRWLISEANEWTPIPAPEPALVTRTARTESHACAA